MLPRRLRLYNSVLDYRHDRPVVSVAVVLRPEADSPQLTGLLERRFADQEPIALLRYRVVRVWQLPTESLLRGGIGTLPLAPVSDVSEARVPDIIRRMSERLSQEHPRRAGDLWAATLVLLGLRYSKGFARLLFREVIGMKESVTYQMIVDEGRVSQAHRILFRLGERRFGPPDEVTTAALNAIDNVRKLDRLIDRILDVDSWQELLSPTRRRRRNGRQQGNA